jgi:putative membrane protein
VHPYSWSLHAEVLVLVPILAAAYAFGAREDRPRRVRVVAFLCGLALIVAVFVTPVEEIALHYLLTAHLLQNVVLAEWAPALCLLGLPPALAARIERRRLVRRLTHPLVALPLWLATYFLWHLPPAYDAALRNPATLLHLEHLCYFAAGLLLWWPVVTGRVGAGATAAYLFAAFVLASPLGLLLALLPNAVYGFYEDAPRLWGLSPIQDQQIAGMTMAAEEALVFFAGFAYFFLRFLREQEELAAA